MKINPKFRDGLIIAALAIVVALVVTFYAIFMQNQIFEESSNHLSEIYGQTNAFFQGRVTSHRNLLLSWENYITSTANDSENMNIVKKTVAKIRGGNNE